MDKRAIYRCVMCQYHRQYGFASPPDRKELVRIGCFACGKITQHEFVEVRHAEALAER